MICHMGKEDTVRMMTTKETAEKLDADPGTVRMWCINGTFPNARQEETPRGPIWLIPETDLKGFKRRGRGRPSKLVEENKGQAAEATANEKNDQTSKEASVKETPAKPKKRAVKKASAKRSAKLRKQ